MTQPSVAPIVHRTGFRPSTPATSGGHHQRPQMSPQSAQPGWFGSVLAVSKGAANDASASRANPLCEVEVLNLGCQ